MRLNSLTRLTLAAIAIVVFATSGCDRPPAGGSGSPGSTDEHGDHDHDHADDDHDHDHADDDHDHDHSEHDHPAHGPYGGHIFPLDSPEYQGEWKKYNDNDVIRMYVLDADAKKAVPIKVESFTVIPTVGNEDVTFELEAEDPDAEGKSAVYMLEDKDLTIAIPLGVKIAIKTGELTINGNIKAHKPRDH